MNWIEGPQYDYPEGFPNICLTTTLYEDLDGLRIPGFEEPIPKEFRRYRWVPGFTYFESEDRNRLRVEWIKVSPIPMRTIKWIIKMDQKKLNRINRASR